MNLEPLRALLEPMGPAAVVSAGPIPVPADLADRWKVIHSPLVGFAYGRHNPDGVIVALLQRHLDGGWSVFVAAPAFDYAYTTGHGPAPVRTVATIADDIMHKLGWD